MADFIFALIGLFLEGFTFDGFTVSGRWVLSLGGWKSNVFGETLLGIMVWILGIVLFIALFTALI